MAQIINTNMASLMAQRNLDRSGNANETALQRLSSGLRINSAKDDAAGLAISTRFESQTKGLGVAIRNAGDGVSLAQTAEGALSTMTDNLQRIRELAVQASNATNSDDDRLALQQEVKQLVAEITRTAEETDFNGRRLLDGKFEGTFQIGANQGQVVEVRIAELTADKLGASEAVGISAIGTDSALKNGDLTINGVAIGASKAEDDSASFAMSDTSALAKVEAINRSYDETGVKAYANENIVSGTTMVASAQDGSITLNGVSIDIQTTGDSSTTRASVIQAINAFADQTGVMAVDSGSGANGVNLVAADGRNITIEYDGLTAENTGLVSLREGETQSTFQAGFTLVADRGVDQIRIGGGDGTGNGNIANAGLVAGTYDRGVAQLSSTAQTNTSGVGFDYDSVDMGSVTTEGIWALSGQLYQGTVDLAAGMTGTSGADVFGTNAEVITVRVGDVTQTMTYDEDDMGADTLAAAINAAGAGKLEVSAETRLALDFQAQYSTAGFTTAGTITIRDTSSSGNTLLTITVSSGQSLEQVANAINGGNTSMVATFNEDDGQLILTDITGNSLNVTSGTTLAALQLAAVDRTGTVGTLAAAGTGSSVVFGYIKDVNVTDGDVDQIVITSSRSADSTAAASTFFSQGTGAIAGINQVSVGVNSSTYGLEDGDLVINGVAISAADEVKDTASAIRASDGTLIQTSSKSQSAIAIAAAINAVSGETGVTAEVQATKVVGSSGANFDANVAAASSIYEAGDAGKIYINGVDLGVIALVDDGVGGIDTAKSREAAINLINSKAGLTGVTAEDNGESITLTAADGRNISVAIDNDNVNNGVADISSTGFGALIGLDSSIDGIGEADIGTATESNVTGARGNTTEGAAYETTYGTIKLSSASTIDVRAGTRGVDELQGLGLFTGKFGGGETGVFLKDIDISTFEGAQAAISAVDNALNAVAAQRADLGAIQNRFESTVSNLTITRENLTAANSRIRDADFAAESAELARTQVLQQAGISILAQANQRPQQVLSLLG